MPSYHENLNESKNQHRIDWEKKANRKRAGRKTAWKLAQFRDTVDDSIKLYNCANWLQVGESDKGHTIEGVYLCKHHMCATCRTYRATAWMEKLAPYLDTDTIILDGNGKIYDPHLDKRINALAAQELRMKNADQLERWCEKFNRAHESQRFDIVRTRSQKKAAKNATLTPLFMTLTIPSIPNIYLSGEQILDEILLKPFRRMRESARRRPDSDAGRLWSMIAGGLWTLEITHGKNGYHPHIHMIVMATTTFISKEALQKVWAHYAPGAMIVDVRQARDQAAAELVKYVSKPAKTMTAEATHQITLATKGRRLINTFGLFRGIPEPEPSAGLEVAPVEEAGNHVMMRYFPREGYVVTGSRPATPEDPIIPAEKRNRQNAEGLKSVFLFGQTQDRQDAQRDWSERQKDGEWARKWAILQKEVGHRLSAENMRRLEENFWGRRQAYGQL